MPRDRPYPNNDFDHLGRTDFRGYYRPDSESTKVVSSNSCRCTSQFSSRHADGSCICECFDKQRDCLRLKRGKDFLTHEDRMCILRGDCMSPSCEFGSYLRKQGRCPRKREKFEALYQYPLHDEEYN
ncbi:hypothetical protein L9F63_027254 [Diploptera punctata]|uniref:Uncharacterized protein n=1 Tax=Diploptera punctata TaxID=6984 RepID=A0AAD8EMA3_DIPPU|nr:hypothetical protein L9F63_027254 [Diploptera punctata]